MDQYRVVVKQHTSFTLDLLRHTDDHSTYRYSSNFRQGPQLHQEFDTALRLRS